MKRPPFALMLAASLVLAACNRNSTPEVSLEPTRTIAPRATDVPAAPATGPTTQQKTPAPGSSVRPSQVTGLTAANAKDLKPAFSLDEPPVEHIYTVASDRLTVYNTGDFEIIDPSSLQSKTRTIVKLRSDTSQGYWYAASPNGKVGAIMQTDGSVDIYDLDTGKIQKTFGVAEPSFDVASDIALNNDGTQLVAVSQGKVSLINTADGKATGATQTLPGTTTSIQFSEDATRLAAVQATGEIVIVNPISAKQPFTLTQVFTDSQVAKMAFSPNGDKFGASNLTSLVIWDLSSGEGKVQDQLTDLSGPIEPVFDGSGKYMAAFAGPAVILYDLGKKEGQNEFRLTGNVPVSSVKFDPKGETLFVAGSGELASFQVSDGKPLNASSRPPLTRAAFSPDGRSLATWSTVFPSANVAIINTATGRPGARLTHKLPLRWVTYSQSGKYIATLTLGSTLHVWDAGTGDSVIDVGTPTTDTLRALLCFTSDERGLAYLENDKVLVQGLGKSDKPSSFSLPFKPAAMTTCANDKHLIAAANETSIHVIDTQGKEITKITDGVAFSNGGALYFSQDGTKLSALNKSQLIVWDVATGKQVQSVHLQREPLLGLFNPAGDKFALNFGDAVDVVDITTGKALSLDLPKGSTVNVLFPQDPAVIITAIEVPSKATAAKPIAQRQFVSGELSIWDAASGKLIRTITTDKPILTANISDDGSKIVTSSASNALTVYALP